MRIQDLKTIPICYARITRRMVCFLAVVVCWHGTSDVVAETQIDFGVDVLPILSDACFHCHGPDENTREAGLRLDTQDDLLSMVSAGDPDDSYLIQRIVAEDPEEQMPPSDSHRQLKSAEKQVLVEWVKQGASWSGHWAFEPIEKPELPGVDGDWGRNEIDSFVQAKLIEKSLTPSPDADVRTLLRRVALDVTGLPPRADVAEEFLKAAEHDLDAAYETLVDTLLASPDYGERMASVWMEVARFSESDGYQLDQVRTQYPWRDWVIRAFNDNMPYNQFVLEQTAGDLLPGATEEQIIATGFNRNHVLNGEGGVDPNETRIEVVADRTETTATAFLGLTIGCCRCHDHKFDPLSQEDYFRFFAYFNNVDESGKAGHNANPFFELEVSPEDRKQSERYQANTKHHHIRFPEGNKIRVAVLKDRSGEPRKTFILNRGAWDQPTREVTPAPPASLPSPDGLPPNRLGLARWMIDDSNPLTARVAVNRYWELFFGRGIVTTQEDFGVQSARPSHPRLLDWLAADFRENGWNVKRLIKQIVTSSTYRQSSVCNEKTRTIDPDNVWLARGARFRQPSWMLRDQALAVSELLSPDMFGPSVRPYQPENIWFTPTAGKIRYEADSGDKLYRKSLYTFWRRTTGPANMFDASTRRVCEVNVRRTNTPLHALVTLNDVTFVEAARVLADRVLDSLDWNGEDRSHSRAWIDAALNEVSKRVLLRDLDESEREMLSSFVAETIEHYQSHPEQAEGLLGFGEAPRGGHDAAIHAALTNAVLLIMNTDESLSHF